MLFLEHGIGETALRHPAMQRHLAAFESAFLAASGTRPHTLISTACRFPVPRPRTSPDPLGLVRRSGFRSESFDPRHVIAPRSAPDAAPLQSFPESQACRRPHE